MNAAVLLVSLLASQAPRTLTLENALRTASEHQPLLKEAQAGTSAARARVEQARAGLLPYVNLNMGYSRSTANFVARPGSVPNQLANTTSTSSFNTFDYWNAGLSANQLIYDFGQTTGRWHAAEANADAQVDNEHVQRLSVELNVRTAFYAARAAKALVDVAKKTVGNQQKHLDQVRGFVEVGTRPEIDLAQVRTDLANARVQLINAENGYESSRANLNNAMGIEGDTGFDVADVQTAVVNGEDSQTTALVDEALKARPEFQLLSSQTRAQELTVHALRGSYAPALSASVGATEAGRDLGNLAWNMNGGLNLSWNLFSGFATRAQVEEANSQLRNLNAQMDELRQRIILELEQARLGVRAAKAVAEAAGEAQAAARDRLKLAEGRYAAGVGNIIELGDAQLALTSAEAQAVQADYNVASARARLEKALGRSAL